MPDTIASAQTPEDVFLQQCEDDYAIAELTTVAHVAPGRRDAVHLLGIVELLPPALERNPNIGHPPDRGGYPRRLQIGTRAGAFYIQRWHRPVRDAMHWYRGCLSGSMAVPGYKKSGKAPDTIVSLPAMGEDPPWPSVVVQQTPFWDNVTPFWGTRPGGARWHRLLPVSPLDIPTQDWSLEDWEKARQLLRGEIHIDLLSRSVLLGSCHLLLPNPVFSDAAFSESDDLRSVALEITPYPGQTTAGLEFIVWNQRSWGVTSVIRKQITSNRTEVLLPEGAEETAHAIVCSKRGLLEKTQESTSIRSVHIGMNLITEHRQVQVPARSKRQGPEAYTVPVSGVTQEIIAGSPRAPTVMSRLSQDESLVKENEVWEQLQVRWFDKDVSGGRQQIRDIIGTAREQLDLLDPYFGANDLLGFAVATSVRGLPVRILTSADFCQKYDSKQQIENGEVLLNALLAIRKQDPKINIEIKVMPGEKSPVHDRFLIVDGMVWVLGASLNEFGERGTLLIRLPRPPRTEQPRLNVLSISDDVFESIWSRSKEQLESIEDFVARRAAARQQIHWKKKLKDSLERCRKVFHDVRDIWRAR